MALSGIDKLASNDRVIILEPINGEPRNYAGAIDRRLFTGDNKLHGMLDTDSTLWHFKYDDGILPEPLRQKFTSFNKLLKHAEDYYKKRNIRIKEVIS